MEDKVQCYMVHRFKAEHLSIFCMDSGLLQLLKLNIYAKYLGFLLQIFKYHIDATYEKVNQTLAFICKT